MEVPKPGPRRAPIPRYPHKAKTYADVKNTGKRSVFKKKISGDRRHRLLQQCDKAVSFYVIHRDGQCVTCGSRNNLSCSHLFRRGRMPLRFDLFNCNCQCITCNGRHSEHPEDYNNWFIRKYGAEKFEELQVRSWEVKKWAVYELVLLIESIQKLSQKYLLT